MPNDRTKITIKIEQYENELADHVNSVERLKIKLEVLRELLGDASGVPKNLQSTNSLIKAVVSEASNPITPAEIIEAMLSKGWKGQGENWKISVHTACNRLAKRSVIQETIKDGKKAFTKVTTRGEKKAAQ